MKLILDFRYQCEVEVKDEEIERAKDNLKRDRIISDLSDEINDILLVDDGRAERGRIVDYDYELRED